LVHTPRFEILKNTLPKPEVDFRLYGRHHDVGAEIRLLDGKGSNKKECIQSTFKSDNSVPIADIE